jgi:hypothetical protein
MHEVQQFLNWWIDLMLGRASGPLHFRFLIMPAVVTVLAVRAGLKDAREGRSKFLWTFFTKPEERSGLFRSALKDIGKILIVALVMDTAYQIIVFRSFYPGQALFVAFVSAVVPYVVFRGPISVLVRALRDRAGSKTSSSNHFDEHASKAAAGKGGI